MKSHQYQWLAGAYDLGLDIIRVKSHQYQWLAGAYDLGLGHY